MSHSHMVIFQTQDGNPGYRQFEEIADTVAFVETMRNDQDVDAARIFRLKEVHFEFQPYYRVSVSETGAEAATAEPDQGDVVAGLTGPTTGAADSVPADSEPVAENGQSPPAEVTEGSADTPEPVLSEPDLSESAQAEAETAVETVGEETASEVEEPPAPQGTDTPIPWGAPPPPGGEAGVAEPVGAGADSGTSRRGLFGR